MSIRPHKITDLSIVKEGYLEIFKFDYLSRISVSEEKKNQILKTLNDYAIVDTSNYNNRFYIYEQEEKPVGFISFTFDKFRKICSITGLYVQEEYRGKGFAKALLKVCNQKALDYGMNVIRVNVLEDNKAVNLYKSSDFSQIGQKITCKT